MVGFGFVCNVSDSAGVRDCVESDRQEDQVPSPRVMLQCAVVIRGAMVLWRCGQGSGDWARISLARLRLRDVQGGRRAQESF